MDSLSTPPNLQCSKHPKKQVIFIQVNQLQADKNIFFCDQCMLYDKKFQVSNCVQTQQIIENSDDSQIFNWPPVDDETLQDQIYNIQTQDKRSNKLLQQINEYFDELKTEVFLKIESRKKEMIKNATLFTQYEDQILNKLQDCQMADQFKKINGKENECREFIYKFHSQKQNYTHELKQIFENLNKKEQSIDFESPNQLKRQIFQLVEKINFFKKESSQANYIRNQTNIVSENKQSIQREMEIEKMKNIDLLPDLFLTKSNYKQNESKNLQMKKLGNNQIQIISKEDYYGSYYSNLILERNKKYVFRFQFKITKKQGEGFMIGLVRDSTKNKNYSYNDKLSCFFIYQDVHKGYYPGDGIDKCIKGDLRDTKEIECLELRVCIENEQLEVLEYPKYNSKYIVSDQYKNNLKTYQNLRLGIYLQNDIDVILINAHVCEEFDN